MFKHGQQNARLMGRFARGAPTNGSIFSKLPVIWTVCLSWINYPYINVYYEKEKYWGGKNIARAPLAPGLHESNTKTTVLSNNDIFIHDRLYNNLFPFQQVTIYRLYKQKS